jgi:serine/threonine protein kinase
LLRKEFQILSKLDHPNIIKPLDFYGEKTSDFQSAFLCVPYYKQGELFDLVKKTQGLGEIGSRGYFKQVSSALTYLHEANIAHRDIKLENILIDDSLNAQLIDFGF